MSFRRGKACWRTRRRSWRMIWSGLNSVVYVWANHDIVESMNSVKESLAKPQTDAVTQAEQTRIEDQLQAMIDSLSVKPKEIPFANKGGGSGQCKPGLPTEAELRLEKALQQAVNKATVTISKNAGNQDPALLAAWRPAGATSQCPGSAYSEGQPRAVEARP